MNFLHLPIPLFFILQLFASIVWSQEASSSTTASSSSTASSSGSTPSANATATGTASSTSSASLTNSAQFPSLTGVPPCVSNCLASASANLNCTSQVDVDCFCNSTNYPVLYPAQLLDCVLANCSDQVSTIESLGQQFCNLASGHPTLSFLSVPITTTTGTSSTSSSSTSTSTSTSTAPSSSTTTTNTAAKSVGSTSLMGLGAIMVLVVLGGV